MKNTSMPVCTNCSHPLQSESNYCSHCGQSVVSFQKPIKPVLADMIHETLDIDGRMFLSLKTLFLKPGLLSLEYAQGKRMKYTPPLRMYLVISIIFFVLIAQLAPGGLGLSDNLPSHSEYYPRIMFLLLPVFALLLQFLFKGTFYLLNLIFSIHIHCISYLVFLIMFPLEAYEKIYPIFMVLQFPLFFYLIVYSALAIKKYYAQSWPKTLGKLSVLVMLYVAIIAGTFEFILGISL